MRVTLWVRVDVETNPVALTKWVTSDGRDGKMLVALVKIVLLMGGNVSCRWQAKQVVAAAGWQRTTRVVVFSTFGTWSTTAAAV